MKHTQANELNNDNRDESSYSRRDVLKMVTLAGTGIVVGSSGMASFFAINNRLKAISGPEDSQSEKVNNDVIPFYGERQAGIGTAQQMYMCFAAFDIISDNVDKLKQLLKIWTDKSAEMTAGRALRETNGQQQVNSSEESTTDSSAKLTITFGFGSTLFTRNGIDRFGLGSQCPDELRDIPSMPGETINSQISGGDICIQVCASDPTVAFHVIRNLAAASIEMAVIRWIQTGFIDESDGHTPRNLFGFKDGTANIELESEQGKENYVWVDSSKGPAWMTNGTYLVARKIRMDMEKWEQTFDKKQEAIFGRSKNSGAPFGMRDEFDPVSMREIPSNSHVWLARSAGTKILRRSYSYFEGIDPVTGNLNAGLFFISFQKSVRKQLVPMLSLLAKSDALNPFISTLSSSVFACPPGSSKGGFIGEQLFKGI
ncbi:putative deferrochelatase/peroxidase EfeN [Paenibacillus chitinolyticus]|uniref:Dyp-type peroxidase n=1 Tax=Paenibacillus chitinolyticus TaxID=79263 RepID=UPI0026E4AFF1|nr:Dyp-type peroxidase [Paenibacillus chitinolyticus]GKS13169.1 putative deferrochelatase/peroxidase EfeN [Paenibacillus chitinolyticus]